MLVTTRVFGKVMDLLGIRENVALTKVDLSRAVPVVPLEGAILAEHGEHRVFIHNSVQVGAATIPADPRDATDWDAIIFRGSEDGGAVPAGHDYLIYNVGADLSVSTDVVLMRAYAPTTGAVVGALAFWGSAQGLGAGVHNDGPVLQNLNGAFYSPAGDPSLIQLRVGAAVTIGLTFHVISAPPGLLFPGG